MLLQIPLRNLTRNLRRTLLGIAIIALGTTMSYGVIGYVDFSVLQIRESVVQQFGNIQIGSNLLWAEEYDEYDYLLAPDAVEEIYAALDADERITAKTQQLNLSGIAYIGNRTQILRVTALEPGNEALDYNDLVVDGVGLSPEDRGRVLIGRTFARQFGLEPEDNFTLQVYTVSGQLNQSPVRVAGIFELTDGEIEGQVAFMPIDFGKLLLNTDSIAKVIATTQEIDQTNAVAASIQSSLAGGSRELIVKTWFQLSEFFQQILGFFNVLFGFITFSMFVLVFFMILQVLTLSFLERTREIGTIRAIGTTKGQVFGQFFFESLFLGVVGATSGIALGWLIGQGFNAVGLGWTPPGGTEDVPIQVSLTLANAWMPFLATSIATLISSLYPAIKTSNIKIVDALRTS